MNSVYYVAVVTRAYRKAIDKDKDLDQYRKDLFDVSHREFTTGFFFSSGPVDGNADVSRPTSYGYERNYMFLGTVLAGKEDGVYELDVRNQIRKDDALEFIGPDVPLLSEKGFVLLDENGEETEKLDHGKKGYIRTSLPLRSGYIMRKEAEEKHIR